MTDLTDFQAQTTDARAAFDAARRAEAANACAYFTAQMDAIRALAETNIADAHARLLALITKCENIRNAKMRVWRDIYGDLQTLLYDIPYRYYATRRLVFIYTLINYGPLQLQDTDFGSKVYLPCAFRALNAVDPELGQTSLQEMVDLWLHQRAHVLITRVDDTRDWRVEWKS